jgi:hypothetical protein
LVAAAPATQSVASRAPFLSNLAPAIPSPQHHSSQTATARMASGVRGSILGSIAAPPLCDRLQAAFTCTLTARQWLAVESQAVRILMEICGEAVERDSCFVQSFRSAVGL